MLLGYLPVLLECLLSYAQARQVCRRDSLYLPRYLVITVVDGDTIKGTLYINAAIQTAFSILCVMTFFKRNCVFVIVARLVLLQIIVIKECIYSERHVIAGVTNLHINGVADWDFLRKSTACLQCRWRFWGLVILHWELAWKTFLILKQDYRIKLVIFKNQQFAHTKYKNYANNTVCAPIAPVPCTATKHTGTKFISDWNNYTYVFEPHRWIIAVCLYLYVQATVPHSAISTGFEYLLLQVIIN